MFLLRMLALLAALALTLAGCGGGDGTGAASPSRGHSGDSPTVSDSPGNRDGEVVEEKVITKRMPDGTIKKTTITTTRKVVEAPAPPPRPEDPYPSDTTVRYNVEQINKYRKTKGLSPVLYDAKISEFATAASRRLAKDHKPHAHFAAKAKGAPGFGSRTAENQGDPRGVPSMDADPVKSRKKQIDIMLKLMFDEGPGGGHYDNMMNPHFRRVGIGNVDVGGRMYMTNDFSN
jgi:hypothetical protein